MKSDIYVLTSARDVCVTDCFCCFYENQNNLTLSCCFCKNSIRKHLYLSFCSFEFLVQKCGISDISAFPRCQRSRRLPSSMNQSFGGYWSLNVIAVLHKPALLLSPCRSLLYSQLKERVLRIFLHLFIWAARARMRIPYLQLNAQQIITSARFEQLNIVTGVGAHLCTIMLFYSDLQKCTVELYELELLKLQIKSIFTSLLTKCTDL